MQRTRAANILYQRRDSSGGIAAMPGPFVFIFLLAKGLRGKAFKKGSIAVSRRFRRLAGNYSDGQPPVQLA